MAAGRALPIRVRRAARTLCIPPRGHGQAAPCPSCAPARARRPRLVRRPRGLGPTGAGERFSLPNGRRIDKEPAAHDRSSSIPC